LGPDARAVSSRRALQIWLKFCINIIAAALCSICINVTGLELRLLAPNDLG
jgi:hypothetical protein